jgi:UDP-N-acetylmuramate dehydrogenase
MAASEALVEDMHSLEQVFGERVNFDVPLAGLTASRIGGPADVLITVNAVDELVSTVTYLWEQRVPFVMLGGGSNILVSDAGVRGVVLSNRARQVRFEPHASPPTVYVESGANLGLLARQAAARGLVGLEWAGGIPGTVGGAVVGNAGAHGGDMAGNLLMAEILHLEWESGDISPVESWPPPKILREWWRVERMEYGYRTSIIKRDPGLALEGQWPKSQPRMVVLAASLVLETSTAEAVQAKMSEFVTYRRRTQPPGASMGSMFKNPAGDFAGRLIEEAGLKGARIGNAEISNLHANFFINRGGATAKEVWDLIQMARRKVAEETGVVLDLEIEQLGEWEAEGSG